VDETLRREVRFLTTRLGAIIREQCPSKTFDAIETLRGLAKQIRQNPDSFRSASSTSGAARHRAPRAAVNCSICSKSP
jgi:phosphoenolpyruvate carboxylase